VVIVADSPYIGTYIKTYTSTTPMLAKQSSPFRNEIKVAHKKLQVLKLREYIYIYLLKKKDVTEAEACAIACLDAEQRLEKINPFSDNDLNYINGRLEEIDKLNSEIYNTVH
jgi:hypothetical protein